MNNFAITGAAGYIAPRHMAAIRDTNNHLIAALDPHDSVGVLDNYFPDTLYFSETDLFVNYIKTANVEVQYMSICSPNYLHVSQILMGLDLGLNVICEKPLALNMDEIHLIQEAESSGKTKVSPIMQLRSHPSIMKLKSETSRLKKRQRVQLTYVTSRGPWYQSSWKGNVAKSGGLAMAIGIHFFDLLLWIFGPVEKNYVHLSKPNKMAGFLELEKASVSWYLSIDQNDLSKKDGKSNSSALRSLLMNDEVFDFSSGLSNLHTDCYKEIIQGRGLTIDDSIPSINVVTSLSTINLSTKGELHPLIQY